MALNFSVAITQKELDRFDAICGGKGNRSRNIVKIMMAHCDKMEIKTRLKEQTEMFLKKEAVPETIAFIKQCGYREPRNQTLDRHDYREHMKSKGFELTDDNIRFIDEEIGRLEYSNE